MDNIKLTAKFILNGASMYSEAECEKDSEKYQYNFMMLHSFEGGKNTTEKVTFLTRRTKPIFQVINISQDAYEEWLNHAPYREKYKLFKKLSNEEKIKAHLEEIATHINGKYHSHFVYPD